MNNPNVAQGASTTPNMLDSVGAPFQCSNAQGVQGVGYIFGQQSPLAGQPAMAPIGTQPTFETLQPMPISSNPGPMGTNHKP